jgi:hypothetical protein
MRQNTFERVRVPGFGESHVNATSQLARQLTSPQTFFSTIQIQIEEYFDEKVFILGRHCHGSRHRYDWDSPVRESGSKR